jgi:hypothetical protein
VGDAHPVERTLAGPWDVEIGVEVDIRQADACAVSDRAGDRAELNGAVATKDEDVVAVGQRSGHRIGELSGHGGDSADVACFRTALVGAPHGPTSVASVDHIQAAGPQRAEQTMRAKRRGRALLAGTEGTGTRRRPDHR